MKRFAVLAALAAGLTLQASVAFGQQAPDGSSAGAQTSASAGQTNQAGSASDVVGTIDPAPMVEQGFGDSGKQENDEPNSK